MSKNLWLIGMYALALSIFITSLIVSALGWIFAIPSFHLKRLLSKRFSCEDE